MGYRIFSPSFQLGSELSLHSPVARASSPEATLAPRSPVARASPAEATLAPTSTAVRAPLPEATLAPTSTAVRAPLPEATLAPTSPAVRASPAEATLAPTSPAVRASPAEATLAPRSPVARASPAEATLAPGEPAARAQLPSDIVSVDPAAHVRSTSPSVLSSAGKDMSTLSNDSIGANQGTKTDTYGQTVLANPSPEENCRKQGGIFSPDRGCIVPTSPVVPCQPWPECKSKFPQHPPPNAPPWGHRPPPSPVEPTLPGQLPALFSTLPSQAVQIGQGASSWFGLPTPSMADASSKLPTVVIPKLPFLAQEEEKPFYKEPIVVAGALLLVAAYLYSRG